jgi:hypothetical protein
MRDNNDPTDVGNQQYANEQGKRLVKLSEVKEGEQFRIPEMIGVWVKTETRYRIMGMWTVRCEEIDTEEYGGSWEPEDKMVELVDTEKADTALQDILVTEKCVQADMEYQHSADDITERVPAEEAIQYDMVTTDHYETLEQIVADMTEAINIPNTKLKVVKMQMCRDKVQKTIKQGKYLQDGTK